MAHLLRALPSLEDMILRRAKEPLCLFNYWQYLADIEAAPEELEFWLSLADYERLHRRYTATANTNSSLHHEDARAMQSQPLLPSAAHEDEDEKMDVPTEQDMRRAAERLYFHYFLPESPAPLRISDQMRDEIASCVEKDQRYDAQLFAPAKRHAFMVMRDESYLRFLRERLFHNITRGTAAPRIALGLALIFIALTFQLTLIFLDVKPKGWRWLPMAALWPGFIYVFAGVTRLDPFMALLGRYESTAWSFGPVKDNKIHHSHLKRASLHLAITVGISAILTLIMFLVPGNRL
ncbi:hypothetical protein COEREDRAFT_37730 [Coemansia reversa NRRL 1564]|uniref:RGS domain-containing protein n=1 Tax=Coemansia reversa (strain ATCC 12441 / NRRL 1564) TaxID=763665 RepID=A0A2G5BJQ4_COERN|nr:hypothetical protein COEREDRAFT_37730 [Coemansia reversa NRRL 1564]|eukprot:PIA19236.1 hypothetical protein COEREDRAFT_37730 [Coemansia reversa NRRL 1564]